MIPKFTEKYIYGLLPSIYRQKDYENNEILKTLLEIISREVQLIENDIYRMYDNWFIETCDDWVIPYIGDLVGVTNLNQITGDGSNFRRYVADSIKYRKRKGTLQILEIICKDITGWNVKFVEFFKFLNMSQYINHVRLNNISTIDFRNTRPNSIYSNLDNFNHLIDVKNISSGKAYYNIQNVGIFVWRLNSYPVFNAPAFKVGKNQFKFSQLGYDIQLFKKPDDKITLENLEVMDGPLPISRVLAGSNLDQYYSDSTSAKSVEIYVNQSRINSADIAICDLSKWEKIHSIDRKVAFDPVLGRIFTGGDETNDVHVSYYYGSNSDLGANNLQQTRENEEISTYKLIKVKTKDSEITSISKAIENWRSETNVKNTVIEISDSEVYEEDLEIHLPENITLLIRSTPGERPIIRMKTPMKIKGENNSNISFNGVILDTAVMSDKSRCILHVKNGDLQNIVFDHCPLVPSRIVNDSEMYLFSWNNINNNNKTSQDFNNLKNFLIQNFDLKWLNSSPSNINIQNLNNNNKIEITASNNSLSIELNEDNTLASLKLLTSSVNPNTSQNLYEFVLRKEIMGEIRVFTNKISIYLQEGNNNLKISLSKSIAGQIMLMNSRATIEIKDSIIDEKYASSCIKCFDLSVFDSTIFGKTIISIMSLASNTIFMDLVTISRRQVGCARYCYFGVRSVLPKHYKCVDSTSTSTSTNPILAHFTSTVYGDAGYGQLNKYTCKEIFEGGNNHNELGAFKHLEQAKRIKNLEISLKEFMRFGMDVGIYWEN